MDLETRLDGALKWHEMNLGLVTSVARGRQQSSSAEGRQDREGAGCAGTAGLRQAYLWGAASYAHNGWKVSEAMAFPKVR